MFKKAIPILLLLCVCDGYGVTIGSDTAVTRFNTQQMVLTGDRIATFAWLAAGFQLVGSYGVFDSVFPVSGNVELNASTLYLNQDLILHDVTNFNTLGSIVGQGHELWFAPRMSTLPLSSLSVGGCAVSFLTSIGTPLAINSVDWSYDNRYLAAGIDFGGSTEVRIYEFDGTALTLIASDDLDSNCLAVRWHPSLLYLAATLGPADVPGVDIFVYSLNPTTSVATLTGSDFLTGGGLALAWHPTGDYLAASSTNATKEIEVWTFSSGPGTIAKLFDYNLPTAQAVQHNTLSWSPSGNFLAAGLDFDGANDELIVLSFNGTTLSAATSAPTGATVSGIDWQKTGSRIAVGLSGTTERLRIYDFNETTVSISEDMAARTGETDSVITVNWNANGTCLAAGLPFSASASEFRVYDFNGLTSALTLNTEVQVSNDVNEVRWSPSQQYIAFGGEQAEIDIYATTTGVECFEISDLKIFLDCNLTLQNCCLKFSGHNFINGQGYNLTLKDTCTLIVNSESDLWFKNVTLKNIRQNKLGAVDATSTYSFSNAAIVMDGNITFTRGKFDILYDTEIQGDGFVFAYQTDAVSTISACGKLILDAGVTFSYAPSVASNSLLRLSEGAELILNSARLHASSAGLRLTTGALIIDGASFLSSDATSVADAIRFGDGISTLNNLCIRFLPAGTLELLSGIVVYDNI